VQAESSSSSGILSFIGAVVKIFLFILGIILVVILIGYIIYRISRKNDDIGFQDFLIDSVFHTRKPKVEVKTEDGNNLIIQQTSSTQAINPLATVRPKEEPKVIVEDPLKTFSVPAVKIQDPLETPILEVVEKPGEEIHTETLSVPDWLKAPNF
jgi:hypothetical protein